ncbi:hypothetical protein [Escherichia phage dw-ec]|nr:hypothetical protein [Escherichia phage BI-EHEC]UJQ43729.1 hypothetical protein [Escherichia phage dw-ec]
MLKCTIGTQIWKKNWNSFWKQPVSSIKCSLNGLRWRNKHVDCPS